MKFPFFLTLGSLKIPAHWICEILSYTLGYRFYSFLRKKKINQLSEDNQIQIFISAAFGAFLGSHILGILENPQYLNQLNILYFMGNTTIVGGFLGGLIGVEIIKKKLLIRTSTGDLMVYPIILGMVIGRFGCFLAGLPDGTYGKPTTLPWGIDFGDNIKRHPTNLYEITFWLSLSLFLFLLEKKIYLIDGARFKILLTSYLFFRLLIEFIKPAFFFDFGLSVIQIACIVGLIYYNQVWLYPLKLIKNRSNA